MSEEEERWKGSAIKGVAIGFALQFAVVILAGALMLGAAVSQQGMSVLIVVLILDLAVIALLIGYWYERGESRTMSGFLIVISVSALVLVPCWGLILTNAR